METHVYAVREFAQRCTLMMMRQQAILDRLGDRSGLGKILLATLEQTRRIAVLHHNNMEAQIIRELRIEVLRQYNLRGEMIAEIDVAMSPFGAETEQCLELHRQWADFIKAERWNAARNGEAPDGLDDALRLIELWKAQGKSYTARERRNASASRLHRNVTNNPPSRKS